MKLTVNGKPPGLKLINLADLKRAIRTHGVSMHVEQHWQSQLVGTTRTPKAIRNNGKPGVQTNGYYFDSPNREGEIKEMWADLPKAAELAFPGDDRVIFYPGTERSWTLRFSIPPEG